MNMVSQTKLYAKKMFSRIEPWLNGPEPITTTHRLCLSFEGNTISLLHVNNIADNVQVLLNENLEFDNTENLSVVLDSIVKRFQLEKIPSYWLLSPEDYQLFFLDSVPVKGDEFKDALNWRLRSLISYPIQEAASDYFTIPAKKGSSNQPMVVAVTSRKQQLATNVTLFDKAGISMAAIDIPELAMRNLSAICENDEKSTAFLYFYKNMAILNLTRQKILYFTRRITLPTADQDASNLYETLSLEILRYFDYFQSQWRYPNPSRFYVASYDGKTDPIIAGLTKHLMIPLEAFPLTKIVIDNSKLPMLEHNSLLSLGTVLRQEETNVTAKY